MGIHRHAPYWVRQLGSSQLHGLALKLRNSFWAGDASLKQEWLFDVVCNELEWRSARPGRGYRRCVCELCMPPFPDTQEQPF